MFPVITVVENSTEMLSFVNFNTTFEMLIQTKTQLAFFISGFRTKTGNPYSAVMSIRPSLSLYVTAVLFYFIIIIIYLSLLEKQC